MGKFFVQVMKVEIEKTDEKYCQKKQTVFSGEISNKLAEIYGEINKLETTEIELKFWLR
jgi:Ca-activated chloride channel family protein